MTTASIRATSGIAASYSSGAAATTLTMNYGGGGAGLLQAWLDGVYLGQNVLANNVVLTADDGDGHVHDPDRAADRRAAHPRGHGPQRWTQRGRRRQRRAEGRARSDLGQVHRRQPGGGQPADHVADPGRPRRRGHRRSGPRGREQRRAVRRAPRLVPARLPGRRLGDGDGAGAVGDVGHRVVPDDVRPTHPEGRRRVARASRSAIRRRRSQRRTTERSSSSTDGTWASTSPTSDRSTRS